jgi:hypothetical protein
VQHHVLESHFSNVILRIKIVISKIEQRIKLKNEVGFFIVTLCLLKQQVWSEKFKEHRKACLLRKQRTGEDRNFILAVSPIFGSTPPPPSTPSRRP